MVHRNAANRPCSWWVALTVFTAGCNDAATSWVAAGTLFEPRSGHSATPLPNNAVLFAGGTNADRTLATTEWRDTSTNLWSLGAPMQNARAEHAAVSLDDGRVFVFGGTNASGDVLASVESFDVEANTWSFGANMPAGRTQHTATKIDTLIGNVIVIMGGASANGETLGTVALYDVTTRLWVDANPMVLARRDHTATLLRDGSILIVGGLDKDGKSLATAEIGTFSTQTGAFECVWKSAASMAHARHGHTATRLTDGRVLIVGGGDDDGPLDSIEVYDDRENLFVEAEPMSSPRAQHTTTWLADGSVVVVGGKTVKELVSAERLLLQDDQISCRETADCPTAMVCNAQRYCEQEEWPLSSQSGCTYAGERAPVGAGGVGAALAIWFGALVWRRKRFQKRLALFLGVGFGLFFPRSSSAQTSTFYLDRLSIAGGSEDGTAVWRPVFGEKGLFGQLALGYAHNPLRVSSFVHDATRAQGLSGSAVSLQMTGYATAGVEIANRGAIQMSLPYVIEQRGYATDNRAVGLTQPVNLASSALGDIRIDGRMLVAGTASNSLRVAVRGALFLPTGDRYSFTGERSAWGNLGLSAEYNTKRFFLTANAGWTVRPQSSLVDLKVGSEFVYALGGYIPVFHERLRLGAEIWGSVGLVSNARQSIPLEGAFSMRLGLDARRRFFLGLNAGGRLGVGYAPEMRFVARIGGVLPFADPPPEPSLPVRIILEADPDKDGFVDMDDKCPLAKEDNKHEKDGCPETDEDNDGMETRDDQCPNEAEDKDGLDDEDGCPEEDADEDGFADTEDKCPKDPGVQNQDPAKLGCPRYIERTMTEVLFNKKIEFEIASATIRVTSYPILDEIAKVLLANPQIKRMRIEGYTDNAGDAMFNRLLSKRRAEAVRRYLVQNGKVKEGRLSAAGFGPAKPIAPNDTEEGRAKNRRVELHYGDDDESGKEKKP